MLGPFSATVLDYEPRTRLPRHHHAPATLSLILEGAQRETVGSRQYDCPVHSRRDDPRLRRAMDYLEAYYRTRLTVAEVAAQSGIHPSYLAELFRNAYGSSVGEWVRNRRLEFARDALRNQGLPQYQDLITGVDHLIAQGFVDSSRVGAAGWSAAGYIVAFGAVWDSRFRA